MVVREANGNTMQSPQNFFCRDSPPHRDPPLRDPPPYPAHLTQFYTPGYRQSYSGSETSTDMSLSSTENLSSTARQDPQGEETVSTAPSPSPSTQADSVYSVLPGSPGVEVKTNSSAFYITGSRSPVGCAHPEVLIGSQVNAPYLGYTPFTNCSPSNPYLECSVGSPTFINCGASDMYTAPFNCAPNCMAASPDITNGNVVTSNGMYVTAGYTPTLYTFPGATYSLTNQDKKAALKPSTPIDIKNNKLNVPKIGLSHSYPPPEYPGIKRTLKNGGDEKPDPLRRSFELRERVQLTGSQPDLVHLNGADTSPGPSANQLSQSSPGKTTETKESSPTTNKVELDHAAIATRATQMVERLSEENRLLRKDLENYLRKVSKLEKFEEEIQKVQGEFEGLVKQSNKRENMEKVMRHKMMAEIKKITETNHALKDQLDKALTQLQQKEVYNLSDSELKQELSQKDSTMAKLIAQNKEMSAGKERLDIEVAAQRSTLTEQRAHIEVLDNALTNAHANIIRIEEQLRLRQGQDAKIAELEHAVAQLQRTSEKREAIELRLRARLEDQLKTLRAEKAGVSVNRSCDADEGISSDTESPTSSQGFLQDTQDKEARLLQLEAEVLKWEQRYLEESALRQLAVDAASMPKDARIAALEQSSVETEKIIADSRHERLQHLEEVYQANRKAAELEAKVKTLQAQLAEKDAMISVLQRHSTLSRCSSISSLLGSPTHSSRPSLLMNGSPPGSRPSLHTPSPPPCQGSISSPPCQGSLSSPPCQGSLSSPPSGVPSRQNSQIDTKSLSSGDAGVPAHTKSNSTGTSSIVPSTVSSTKSNAQVRLLQQKLAAQAALFHSLQSGPEQLSKCLWQV